MIAKTFKFIGDHPDLHTGTFYSIREYSEVAEVGYKTLYTRFVRYRYSQVNNDVLMHQYSTPKSNLQTYSEKLMSDWLRKPLTKIDYNYKEHQQ